MFNWIQLIEKVGALGTQEVYTAVCHHNGHQTEGFDLTNGDTTDFYDSDPRDMDDADLSGGWTLPGYWPSHSPEEALGKS